jgi:YidC/Oxa1 family membrane protein insertase
LNKRVLLSMSVGLAAVLAWQLVLQPLIFPKKPDTAATEPARTEGAPTQTPPAPKPAEAPAPVAAQDAPEVPPIILEAATCRVTLTNKGAGIREFALKNPSGDKKDVSLLSPHAGVSPHLALKQAAGSETLQSLGWEVVEKTDRSATFLYRLSTGIEIRKIFELAPDAPGPSLKIVMKNTGTGPARVALELLALNGMEHDSDYRYEQYASGAVYVEKGVKPWPLAAIEKGEEKYRESQTAAKAEDRTAAYEEAKKALMQEGGQKSWFGLKNRFFFSALLPDSVTNSRIDVVSFRAVPSSQLPAFKDRKNAFVAARFDPLDLPGGQEQAWSLSLVAGPLRTESLKALPGGSGLLNYGGGCAGGCGPLGFLFKPMTELVNLVAPLILGVLTFLAGLFGNHGVAIMATTLLIRLSLFPLSRKSQVSMYRMQQLGPKIQALRDRYKDDQQKFGMEQMRLFREHKINPLSGCLPVVLQMPIFIAMYSVFELSVELRGAHFLWMDLSQPDHLVGPWTPWHINLLITSLTIDAFNLLPIVMTVTWFLQSYFAPRSPDPQMAAQQKMMMFMPVMFGLMCYNLASGLSLYFLVNSLLSMTEQKLIKKFILPKAGGPAPAS